MLFLSQSELDSKYPFHRLGPTYGTGDDEWSRNVYVNGVVVGRLVTRLSQVTVPRERGRVLSVMEAEEGEG